MTKYSYKPVVVAQMLLILIRRKVRILILALLIMIAPTVTRAESISRHTKPSYGGTLVWGTRNKPTIINPILTTSSISMSLLDLIFNRLVRLNSKGEIEPDLAESWDISSDGLVYTFYLRKDVRFHDGVECTADDVKFTYDKIIELESNSPFKSHFQLVKDFKAIDRYTFQIVLEKPCFYFIYRLVREIGPRHLLEKADLENAPFNFHPVGTGPFRFKEWGKDNQIVLEYNPDYYEGRPYLDEIVVKTYPTSRDAWIALMRGEVDYVEFIEREDYEIIKGDPSFKAYTFPIDLYYAISYDLNDFILSDIRIREAIAYGINRKSLIDRVAGGYGLECTGPFYPESIGFSPDVKPFEYNPEKSIELLAEAGWHDIDNDGILEKEGQELEVRVLIDSRMDIYKRIIMAVRQELQKIGIRIRVELFNHEDMLTNEFLKQNKTQAYLRLFLAMNPLQVGEDWCSKEQKRFNRLWTYKNEEVDTLFELGKTNKDKKKRQEIYREIHKLIYEDQPACFLYYPFDFHAISNKFWDVDEFFNVNMPYYRMKDWFIK